MSTRDRYKLFSLLGSVNTRLESCLQSRDRAVLPDPCACPLLPNGLVLTLSGELWTCPVLAAENPAASPARVGRFNPALELDEEALARWRSRLSTGMEVCRDCPDCLLCGGGCPRDALASGQPFSAPVCCSVGELVASAVRTNPGCFEVLAHDSRPAKGAECDG